MLAAPVPMMMTSYCFAMFQPPVLFVFRFDLSLLYGNPPYPFK